MHLRLPRPPTAAAVAGGAPLNPPPLSPPALPCSEANMPALEDEVRAPLPTRVERLYGDQYQAPAPPRRAENAVPRSAVDAFRDFK